MIAKNNFLNIRAGSDWLGSNGSTRGFVNFISPLYCYRAALFLILRSYPRRLGQHYTLRDLIYTWCPPGAGDDTPKYLSMVCGALKLNNTHEVLKLSKLQLSVLLYRMSQIEVGFQCLAKQGISLDYIRGCVNIWGDI